MVHDCTTPSYLVFFTFGWCHGSMGRGDSRCQRRTCDSDTRGDGWISWISFSDFSLNILEHHGKTRFKGQKAYQYFLDVCFKTLGKWGKSEPFDYISCFVGKSSQVKDQFYKPPYHDWQRYQLRNWRHFLVGNGMKLYSAWRSCDLIYVVQHGWYSS